MKDEIDILVIIHAPNCPHQKEDGSKFKDTMSSSVGYTPAYANNYDSIDWGTKRAEMN
jgi:hypothetical protein